MLELIQSYVIRRSLVDLQYGPLNAIFMTLYENIKDKQNYFNEIAHTLLKKKGTSRFPTDEEVNLALKNKIFQKSGSSGKKRNYLLERLENFENREPVQIDGNTDTTVEHIFPQNPDPRWKQQLKATDYEQLSEKYLNTLANLTLSGNNGKLSNKTFLEKRDMNTGSKVEGEGYSFSRLWLNKHLSTIDKWDLEELNKRFDLLYQRFLQVFRYPDIFIGDDEVSEVEINIINADINQCKHIDYIVFLGKKLNAKSISDIYECVVKEFYSRSPEVFFEKEVAEYLNTTKDQTKLKTALQLNDTYYIEKGHTKRQKLSLIKSLLRIFDCQDELIIKKLDKSKRKDSQLSLFERLAL